MATPIAWTIKLSTSILYTSCYQWQAAQAHRVWCCEQILARNWLRSVHLGRRRLACARPQQRQQLKAAILLHLCVASYGA